MTANTALPEKKPLFPFGMPLAEMHIHIALALSAEVFLRRIQKGRTTIRPDFLLERDHRYYPTLAHHHATYEAMRHITKTQSELAQVVQDYLERIAKEGAIYAELSNSFRDPEVFESQMDAIEEGIRCARHNTGIEARIVVTSIRNFGAAKAEEAASYLAKNKRAFVTGFGLVGEENLDAFSEYSRAMHIAFHEAGLGLSPHVAEQYLHNAVDFLHTVPKEALDIKAEDHRRLRVGHGTLIHRSSRLMQEFAERAICMEVCLSANKRIGVPVETQAQQVGDTVTTKAGNAAALDKPLNLYFNDLSVHPLTRFVEAGIPLCLGSDNPLLQNTNIGKEHSLAVKAGLVNMGDILNLTANAIRFANVDMVTRLALMQKIDLYRAQMQSGTAPSAAPLGYRRAYNNI